MSELMQAGLASENGIVVSKIPRPSLGPEQVLVRVAAAGVNRADLNAARGAGVASKEALGKPIGMEWSGVIAEIGPGVKGLAPGDRVMCSGTGGYAEYAIADMGRTLTLEDGFDMKAAAVLPLALLTAHDALVVNGRLKPGDSVFVQGASSAVGLMTLQIARALGAGIIFGSSSHPERRARLSEFGATHAIDPADETWPEAMRAATGEKGVDVCVDMVSGPAVNLCMKAAAVRGRIVNVGRLGGTQAEVDLDLHAAKRLHYIGVTFRTRTLAEVREIVARMRQDLWGLAMSGRLRLPIDAELPLSQAGKAHARMAANQHFGKIALIPGS